MKVLLSPRSRVPLVGLCAVILLAGWQSTKAYITDCGAKPIMISEVKFKDLTLEEAVAYVKQTVKKLDPLGNLNVIILGASVEQKTKKISLDVRDISLRSVMEQIAHAAGLKIRVDAHAVVLTSAENSDELSTRTYRVPPDFIATGSAAK